MHQVRCKMQLALERDVSTEYLLRGREKIRRVVGCMSFLNGGGRVPGKNGDIDYVHWMQFKAVVTGSTLREDPSFLCCSRS